MRTPADAPRVVSANRAALIVRISKLDWLTADEAALYCRVGGSTFEKMVKDLPIKFTRPGGPRGDRRFFRAHLDEALMSRVENHPPAA